MTNDAIYSYGLRYDNFKKVFDTFRFNNLPGNEALLLGLGLGSIPFMLEKHFKQPLAYTAVEIDPIVVELAQKYVLDQLNSPIDIIVGDAELYLDATDGPYDIVCLDVFDNAQIPPFFTSDSCFERIAEILSPGGVLLFNHLGVTDKDRIDAGRLAESAKHFFPNGRLVFTGTNFVFVSDAAYLNPS